MNIFASTLLLSRISPNEFLDLDEASRLHYFGPLIGHSRMVRVCRNLEDLRTIQINICDVGVASGQPRAQKETGHALRSSLRVIAESRYSPPGNRWRRIFDDNSTGAPLDLAIG